MVNRNYSSVARAATLAAPIAGSATTVPVSDTTGFPTVPFTLVLDPGRTAEEIITVTAQVGLVLTATRGVDGTTAVPHDAGATVRHMATARDYREPQEHMANESGVHGTDGAVVGDIDDQVLDNKTFQAISTDHTPVAFKAAVSQTAPLLVFQEPGGSAVSSMSYAGGAGMLYQGSQIMTPNTSATVPLNLRGQTSQSAHLLDTSNAAGTVLSYIDQTGKFNGPVAGDIVSTNATITNLTAGNVPFKMRVGSVPAVIAVGDTSVVVTADVTSTGFTQAPYVVALISTAETIGDNRRVTLHRIPPTNNTQIQFRIAQTQGTPLTVLGNYSIQYAAFQMTPSNAAG